MTAQKKRDILSEVIVTVLIVCAVAARAVTRGNRDASYFLPVSLLRSFIYIGLTAWWGISLRQRIIQTQVRRCLEAIGRTAHLDRNTLLKSSPIRGGYVFWQEDISELQDALDRLRLVQDELRDTGDILKEENAQKARKLKLEEQNRLYDLVERESAPQFTRLEALLSALSAAQTQEEAKPLLGRIAVIMTYIKRRSNLIFLAAQKDLIDASELLLCLNESAQARNSAGFAAPCGSG